MSLLCVRKVLFCPVLDCVVFSLAPLIPRCSRQRCLESSPETGDQCMLLCSLGIDNWCRVLCLTTKTVTLGERKVSGQEVRWCRAHRAAAAQRSVCETLKINSGTKDLSTVHLLLITLCLKPSTVFPFPAERIPATSSSHLSCIVQSHLLPNPPTLLFQLKVQINQMVSNFLWEPHSL